jgi:hypothetical protein
MITVAHVFNPVARAFRPEAFPIHTAIYPPKASRICLCRDRLLRRSAVANAGRCALLFHLTVVIP